MAAIALFLIRVYQATLSPLLGNHCRYHPTCSDFTSQAIAKYGFVRGAFLGTKRVLRCHPFHEGGFDPVP
jgi:putative membrane protein insertion efficiency factor